MEFKSREKRNQCYHDRDEYFKCLDEQPSTNSDPKKTCLKLYQIFEQSCGLKWTDHFIKKRDYQRFKDRIQAEGVDSYDRSKI